MNRLFAMMYSKKDRTKIWLLPAGSMLLILLLFGSNPASSIFAAPPASEQIEPEDLAEQEPNALNASAESEDPWLSIPVEKRKLKLMLGASIAVILGFFLVVLMTSLMRMGRQYRRRVLIRKTSKPKEYVDPWSNYRLKENWQDDLPDEFQKPDPQ